MARLPALVFTLPLSVAEVSRAEFDRVLSRLDALEHENARLRLAVGLKDPNVDAPEVLPQHPILSVVEPNPGRRETLRLTPGRRLSSSPTCCRWTQGNECPAEQSDARHKKCTNLHEYLEHKTTTHVFEDVDSCLGTDDTAWGFRYHTADRNASVILSGSSGEVSMPTPLKVTHGSGCTASLLTMQLNTDIAGSLTLNGAAIRPIDLSTTTLNPSNPFASTSQVAVALGLTKTVVLTQTSKMIVTHRVGGYLWDNTHTGWKYALTSLKLSTDGGSDIDLEEGQAGFGGSDSTANFVSVGHAVGIWMGELAAGSHEFKVFIKTNAPVSQYYPHSLQIMVL